MKFDFEDENLNALELLYQEEQTISEQHLET